MLLEEAETEFAEAVAGAGIFGQHGFEVGDGFFDLAGVALDECAVVEGARIARKQGEGLGEIGLGVVVFLPGNFNDTHVGEGVGVVGTQGGDALEGVDRGCVLLGVEQGDAVVVPAHPLFIFRGVGRDGGVFADVEGPGFRGHVDDGHRVGLWLFLAGLGDGVVDEVLIEAAIADGGGEGDLARNVFGQAEAVADQLRSAGLDGVVVGENAVVPDLVEAVELALVVDEAVGEGVGSGIERAVGLEEAGFGEGLAGVVLDVEVDPGFVEVALLGDEGVADALVLNDDVGDQGFTGDEGEGGQAERGDENLVSRGGGGAFFFEGEDVDVEDALAVIGVFEEVGDLL